MIFRISLSLFVAFSTTVLAAGDAAAPQAGKQIERTFADGEEKLPYLLFVPQGYETAKKKWPLMLFLHGSGERGDGNLELVKKHGPPKIVDARPDFPMIVVSPQCPQDKRWQAEQLARLLDVLQKELAVDEQQVYVTGLSMGGSGTWALATQFPERFAAAVPICGRGNPELAAKMKNVPTWVFHGAKDQGVPLAASEEMVHALQAADGKVKFTIYPEAGHDAWTETYANPKLYEWLLEQRKTP